MTSLIVEGKRYRLGELAGEDPLWKVLVDGKSVVLEMLGQPSGGQTLFIRAGGRVMAVSVRRHEYRPVYSVEVNGQPLTVAFGEDMPSAETSESPVADGPALVNSPMAGKIASVKTMVDLKVQEGQSLMVLEAMKMQNDIASPKTGVVKELYVKHGDLVKAGDKLCLVA
jgi:biotin carboxyl carrier protein